jgi:hypothetical protein
MFFVISNIYNKKTKGPTILELFTAIGKLKKFDVHVTVHRRHSEGKEPTRCDKV